MATHSSILTWRIPWTEEPSGLQSMGSKDLDMTEGLTFTFLLEVKVHVLSLFDSLSTDMTLHVACQGLH